MTEPSWSDLPSAGSQRPGHAPRDPELDQLCAEIFTAPAGKQLLAALRARHFDSPFSPMAPERALLVRIVQQHFVRELETACERGLKANAKPK